MKQEAIISQVEGRKIVKVKEVNPLGEEPKPENFDSTRWDYQAAWQQWQQAEANRKEYLVVDEVERLAEEFAIAEAERYQKSHPFPDEAPMDFRERMMNIFRKQAAYNFTQGFTQSNSLAPFSEKDMVGLMNFLSDGIWVGNKTTGKWEQFFNQEIELLPDQLFQLYLDSITPNVGDKIQVEIVDEDNGTCKIVKS